MTKVIFKPTDIVLRISELIDNGTSLFSEKRKMLSIGTYESDVAASINLTHAVRLLESLSSLAKSDLAHLQSALVISRSVFEVSVKTIWMLNTSDKMESEARYVAYLNTEVDFRGKWDREMAKINPGKMSDADLSETRGVVEFSNHVTRMLEQRGYSVPQLPNIRQILSSISEEKKYLYYILLSQYTHFSHHSSFIYQKNLGSLKEFQEDPHLDKWGLAFAVSWFGFKAASQLFLRSNDCRDFDYLNKNSVEMERLTLELVGSKKSVT